MKILFLLAPSKMLYDKYFSSYEFLFMKNWIELNLFMKNWIELNLFMKNWIEFLFLNWIELNWIELNWIEFLFLNWIFIYEKLNWIEFIYEKLNWIFFYFSQFSIRLIKECIYVCLSMQIQETMFMSIAAHLWGCFWAF